MNNTGPNEESLTTGIEGRLAPAHEIGIEFVQVTSRRDIRRPSTFDDEVSGLTASRKV